MRVGFQIWVVGALLWAASLNAYSLEHIRIRCPELIKRLRVVSGGETIDRNFLKSLERSYYLTRQRYLVPDEREAFIRRMLRSVDPAQPRRQLALHYGLTAEESMALTQYVHWSFDVNAALWGSFQNKRLLRDVDVYVDRLKSALQKLPSYRGLVKRTLFVDEVSDDFKVGTKVKFTAFTSTTPRMNYRNRSRVQMIIRSRFAGKYIDDVTVDAGDREVLFPPDTEFLVKRVEGSKRHLKLKVFLEELPSR